MNHTAGARTTTYIYLSLGILIASEEEEVGGWWLVGVGGGRCGVWGVGGGGGGGCGGWWWWWVVVVVVVEFSFLVVCLHPCLSSSVCKHYSSKSFEWTLKWGHVNTSLQFGLHPPRSTYWLVEKLAKSFITQKLRFLQVCIVIILWLTKSTFLQYVKFDLQPLLWYQKTDLKVKELIIIFF